MNTKDLRCFEAVYEERSISRAAQKLYITPQGLSKNIKILENELKTVLFKRTSQGMMPTESAELLYRKAGDIIRQLEELNLSIRQLENHKIIFRIGYACGVFNVIPLRLIQQFIRENDNIRVEWCEYPNREVQEMLKSSRIEYGFVVGACKEPGMCQRKLASRDVLLLVYEGHPLYERESISFEDLQGENIGILNEHFHMYHDFQKGCQSRGITPNIVAKTADSTFLYRLCRQRSGLALVPEFVLDEFKMEHIKPIPFKETFTWDVWGVYKEDNKNYDTIRSFDQFLKNKM